MTHPEKDLRGSGARASDATARKATPANSSTAKAPEVPSSRHVRVHRGEAARGAGVERPISGPWSGKL